MRGRIRPALLAASAIGAAAIGIPVASVAAKPGSHKAPEAGHSISHLILISVDGLHQTDLAWYVQNHPSSTLAKLVAAGADYSNAQTPVPSDSFPGMVAQVTGGNPKTAGVYYDAEYNHNLLPPGTTTCSAGAPLGAQVNFYENLDLKPRRIDAGQGLSGLPGSILQMTGQPQTLIDTAQLPVDPSTCKPIYPHRYLKVNTIFDIARDHGLRTAWSDKHPAYEILNGPGGTGIEDLFAPEINSEAIGYPPGDDWTKDNNATIQYDSYKVQAVLNEIDGYDHSRSTKVGVPAIFGLNFQTVSTAEKLPTSDGLTGGYLPGGTVPGPLLQRALDYINRQADLMVDELAAQHLTDSTAIIISAKHGQSPKNPEALTRIDDSKIVNEINGAWAARHPTDPQLLAYGTDDDAFMQWLSDRSPEAISFVRHWLWNHSATGNTISGGSRTLLHSGLKKIYAGPESAAFFGTAVSDPRHPDVYAIVQHGVVYTGGTGKIAEHGGADPNDRDVPILVYAPGVVAPSSHDGPVETTQIAPTILKLLGLDPSSLQAVKAEGTPVLPGS
jgi:hypothetical protein